MINVNMTPNPYDIQTLHCSQGDEGREFEIKLHNNGEVLDTSDAKEPIVYPVYKGGTEQILPVNGSVPVTSPLKAEIQYPDGVREVEFTYQQTPSSKDGQAKIKSIKGNTVVWNQELISFNGTGIKTTGKNLIDFTGSFTSMAYSSPIILPAGEYYVYIFRENDNSQFNSYIQFNNNGAWQSISTDGALIKCSQYMSYGVKKTKLTLFAQHEIRQMLQINANVSGTNIYCVLTMDGTGYDDIPNAVPFNKLNEYYSPYQEPVITSLPISTYFPTGMKSAGNVYDELTPTKAYTRVGTYTFTGSETWNLYNSDFFYTNITPLDKADGNVTMPNGIVAYVYGYGPVRVYLNQNPQLTTSSNISSYFPSGFQFNYELATPTETSITTASLVSEYGEIPLKAEDDHLVAECTSELSSEAGFHDLKVKLSDEDGDVYSNKIQLHVERRP